MHDRDGIYGSGFTYPFRWDEDSGGAGGVHGAESVAASLLRLFDTAPGEEFMRPDYGCGLKYLIFDQDTEVFKAVAITTIQQAVARWEPRVDEILDIEVETDEERTNEILVRVYFRLIKDQTVYNFVYPFSTP
jgi:uncharacterized protein